MAVHILDFFFKKLRSCKAFYYASKLLCSESIPQVGY